MCENLYRRRQLWGGEGSRAGVWGLPEACGPGAGYEGQGEGEQAGAQSMNSRMSSYGYEAPTWILFPWQQKDKTHLEGSHLSKSPATRLFTVSRKGRTSKS